MQHNRNVSQDNKWSPASDAIVAAFIRKLQPLGTGVLRYGLVGLLLFWGGLKFAQFEAEAIQPLLAYSPLLSWMLAVFDLRTASATIGVIEIIFGLGILTRRLWPRVSGLASLGASGMFLVTLSFLFSTPGVLDPMSPAFGFLVKDLILLGAALYTAGEALHAPTDPVPAPETEGGAEQACVKSRSHDRKERSEMSTTLRLVRIGSCTESESDNHTREEAQ